MNAEKGYQVTIFEKQDFPPVNPSTIAGGMMAPFSEIDTLPLNFVNAGVKGIAMWKVMLDDGADFVFSKEGSLFVAHPADEVYLDRFVQHLHSVSGAWQWVNEKEIRALEPDLQNRFIKGLYIPEEAHLVPLLALEALFKKFISLNGKMIRQEAQPEDLALDYDWVIDCRGYAPQVDQDLRGIKGEILLIRNLEFSLKRPVRLMHPRYPLYIVPRPDHIFAVGATAIENADEDDGLVMLRSAMELMSACYLVQQIEQVTTRTAPQRIGAFLIRFCKKNRQAEGEWVVHLPYDKSVISTRMNIKPETFSRALAKLEPYGVHIEKKHILITDMEALAEFCDISPNEIPC